MGKPSSQFYWPRYLFGLACGLAGTGVLLVLGIYVFTPRSYSTIWPGGLIILAACRVLLSTLAATRSLVIAWRIDDQWLICRCLGRLRLVQCPLNDVTNVLKSESNGHVFGYKLQGSGIPELWLDNRCLADAAELVRLLSLRKPLNRKEMAGSLSPQDLLLALVGRVVLILFFGCPLLVGIQLIGIGLNPRGPLDKPYITLAAGIALAMAGAAGIAYVVRGLSSKAVRVHIVGDTIQWWRLAWPFSIVRNCTEVVAVTVQQPESRPVGVPSDVFHVRFADGLTLELHESAHSNARVLAEMIGQRIPLSESIDRAAPRVQALTTLAPVDFQLADELSLYLDKGEKLLWAGRSVPEKLGIEFSAPGQIGGTLMFFTAIAIIASALAIPRWPAASVPLLPLLLLFAAGVAIVVFRGSQNRRLLRTLYAVTDRRAIVIGGLGWRGTGVTPHREIYSLSPDDIRGYSVQRGGRDIVLTSEWQVVGRRVRYEARVDIGFIAVDDPVASVAALNQLIDPRASTAAAVSTAAIAPRRVIRDGGIRG